MKYIVMECHTSYAVVLDEDGRFLKAANMHYEIGQSVTNVVLMQEPQSEAAPAKKNLKWIYSLGTIAACLLLMITSGLHIYQTPYASVYMSINPEVRIDVNRNDTVVGLEGINEDGGLLITSYSYKKKDLNLVMDELVDRAIEMGFLSEGGQITIELDAKNNEWIVSTGDTLSTHLSEYLTDKISVTIQVGEPDTERQEIVIPINPVTPENPTTPVPDTSYEEEDYEELDSLQENSDEQNLPSATSGEQDLSSTEAESPYEEDTEDVDDGLTDYGESVDSDSVDSDDDSDDDDSDDDDSDDDDTDEGDSSYEEDIEDTDDGQSDYSDSTDEDDDD